MRVFHVRGTSVAIGIIALATLVPVASYAAPPQQREKLEPIYSTSVRGDAAADVLLNDGLGPYADSEVEFSYIRNLIPSVVDDDPNTQNQDRLFIRTSTTGRTMPFSSDLASAAHFGPGSTQPINCAATHILFDSASTPDWYEAVGSVGDTAKGWGNVRCYTTPELDRGYQAFYRATGTATTAGECLQITRLNSTTLVLSASAGAVYNPLGDPSCNASIESFTYSTVNGQRSFSGTTLGFESAPYEVTLDVSPSKGKR